MDRKGRATSVVSVGDKIEILLRGDLNKATIQTVIVFPEDKLRVELREVPVCRGAVCLNRIWCDCFPGRNSSGMIIAGVYYETCSVAHEAKCPERLNPWIGHPHCGPVALNPVDAQTGQIQAVTADHLATVLAFLSKVKIPSISKKRKARHQSPFTVPDAERPSHKCPQCKGIFKCDVKMEASKTTAGFDRNCKCIALKLNVNNKGIQADGLPAFDSAKCLRDFFLEKAPSVVITDPRAVEWVSPPPPPPKQGEESEPGEQ